MRSIESAIPSEIILFIKQDRHIPLAPEPLNHGLDLFSCILEQLLNYWVLSTEFRLFRLVDGGHISPYINFTNRILLLSKLLPSFIADWLTLPRDVHDAVV
jgi:hypothetical protein